MYRTIHAIAVGTAAIFLAISATPGAALAVDISPETEGAIDFDDASPQPIVEPVAATTFKFDAESDHSFSWSSDVPLATPPYVIAAAESDFVPASASSTAIPLPSAIWTGLAGLGTLGTASFLRRLRSRR